MAIATQFLTGFEHGFVAAAASAGGGLFDIVTGTGFSASTTSPRNGAYCAHCVAPANTITRVGKTVSGSKLLIRFAVKLSSRPSANCRIAHCVNSGAATSFYITSSSAGGLSVVAGGATRTGPIIDTANWHLIELQIDSVANTVDWKVDGVAMNQVSGGTAMGTLTTFYLGTDLASESAFTADYDDWIMGTWTNAVTDWYGDGKVLAQRPGSDGNHNVPTSFSPGDAGTAYSGTVTTAYTQVDDPPGTLGWTATRSATDNLAMRVATGNAWLEIAPTPTAETGVANAVRAIISYSSPATQGNLAGCEVRNSVGAGIELWGIIGGAGKAYNIVANQFKSAIVPVPAAGWTAAEVNVIRLRFGACVSADVSPVPTVQAMMLEVDWSLRAITYTDSGSGNITVNGNGVEFYDIATPYDVVIDADSPVSHWKLGETMQALDRKSVTNLSAVNGPIATATALVANAGLGANALTADQNFRMGSGAGLGIPYDTGAFSIEVWVRLSVLPPGDRTAILRGEQVLVFSSDGFVIFSLKDGTNTLRSVGMQSALGAVQHVVVTHDNTELVIYLNGVEQGRKAMTNGVLSNTTDPPRIGSPSEGFTLACDVDEVAWYNAALSPARVLAHYQAGIPGDSGSGTITASGTGIESYSHDASLSGTVTASGSGVESYSYADSGSGPVTASGTGIDSWTISTIYNDSGSGTGIISGISTEAFSASDTGTGTITAGGTSTETFSVSDSSTGTITVSGTKTETFSVSDSGLGAITVSGTSTDTFTVSDTGTGVITVSGTRTEASSYTDIGTGTITALGSGTESYGVLINYTDASSGTVTISGTATEAYSYIDTGTGIVTVSGVSAETFSASDTSSGVVTVSGSRTEVYIYTDTGSGTIAVSGTGTEDATYVAVGTGTAVTAGSSVESASYTDNVTGTATTDGTGVETAIRSASAIGTIVVDGTGIDSKVYDDAGSGALLVSGTGIDSSEILIGYADAGSGQINVNGTSVESQSHTRAAIGSVVVDGTSDESQSHTSTAIGFVIVNGTGSESQSHTSTAIGFVFVEGTASESYDVITEIIYTDLASGSVTSTGTGVDSASYSNSAAGTVTSTGTSDESVSYSNTVTGTITWFGNGVESESYDDTSSGIIVLTGRADENYNYAPSLQPVPFITVIALNRVKVEIWNKTPIQSKVTKTTPVMVQIELQQQIKVDAAKRNRTKVLIANR